MIHRGHDREIVAAPHFPGERGGLYRSVIVARSAISLIDAAASTIAVNEYGSWSGWHGYVAWLDGSGLEPTGERVLTGSHVASAEAVRGSIADVAAIDATIWRELVDQTGLTVIATTDDWPAPPISLATRLDDHTVHRLRDSLRRSGFVDDADDEDYRFMLSARTDLS
jgi:ABC-type phosphate/phosphonate transport system substrate-binding protein